MSKGEEVLVATHDVAALAVVLVLGEEAAVAGFVEVSEFLSDGGGARVNLGGAAAGWDEREEGQEREGGDVLYSASRRVLEIS